jgi:asparagine synthase (glutamine-hydrolysing)
MCGVTGLIHLNGYSVSPVILKKMTDSIAHRGPDGEGHWIVENVGIGHRRLAIIDLSPAAHQPMVTNSGRYILSYNGEIYNYREIRAELESHGIRFRSNSDTEVLLEALAFWGCDAFLKFNGMFALAFWDRVEKTLILARDRYGIKPIYYTTQKNIFAFGSEQRAILQIPGFEKNLNLPALYEYFTFQNIFTDQTLIKDIQILPAGHYLKLNTETKTVKMTQYWDFHFQEPTNPSDPREYEEELDRLFVQAVNRQLVSDVEIGSYLSGGMDSGSITAIAAKSIPELKTFTCGFDMSSISGLELAFDERTAAEALSAMYGTEHYEIVLKAGDMERSLKSVVNALEEPRVGQSYPNYFAAKLASKFVKVVLSGSGGDELFGGYPWRYFKPFQSKNFEDYIDSYYLYWQRLASNSELKELFSPVWDEVKSVWTRDIFRDVFKTPPSEITSPEDYINQSLYFEAKTFLHGLLVVEDKLSMANSLETRVPFLDNDLVDFAMRCPVSLKLNFNFKSQRPDENEVKNKYNIKNKFSYTGKLILKKTLESYLPLNTLLRDKQGFSAPDESWFRSHSLEFIVEKFNIVNTNIDSIINLNKVNILLNDHLKGVKNRRLLIWSLLCVNEILKN